ncbi:MadC family VWA domain-containing protein [Actinomycetospora sp. CA-084318]|uniref:MadC family VWA domain-containing protein n=1 Tax=Actinomycetospora sp. CA-084318 TaxID=3239892 RepID=UPI003D990365
MTAPIASPDGRVGPVDVLATVFAGLLRRCRVAVSPAETIEIRRVLLMLGAHDLDALRAGLRAVSAKYGHERAGFERAFAVFFEGRTSEGAADGDQARPDADIPDGRLPENLDLLDEGEDDPLSRFTDYNPRAAEVGDLIDADEAEKGFNPHSDDDDLSLSTSDSDLSVRDGDAGRRGVTYTVELERAGSAVAGELTSGAAAASSGSLDWDDPAAVLAWLEAVDARSVYLDGAPGDREHLTESQLGSLVAAIDAFVDALAARAVQAPDDVDGEPGDAGESARDERTTLRRACHDLLRRMRGAPRRVPVEHGRGRLDVRRTVHAGLRTDGVPFRLITRTPRPDRLRIVIAVDVSLSVRSVTAFVLRLAQALHADAHTCHVVAFVDTPIEVTDVLLRSSGDHALASVLSAPGLDLDATSDYGRVLGELAEGRGRAGAVLDARTTLLVVGDGRCNGLPPGVEHLEALRRRVHRIGWITPEPRRYWHQASCAMPSYEEVVDGVVVARDGEEFAERAGALGHALA